MLRVSNISSIDHVTRINADVRIMLFFHMFLCLNFLIHFLSSVSSVLWHCWLGVRKSIWAVKIEWWGVGIVICLQRGADCLHMVQLMPLHSTTWPYQRSLFCCNTNAMSSTPSLSLSSLLGSLSFSLTPHIHLTILISARWSATTFSFLKGQVSLGGLNNNNNNSCSIK